MRKGLLSVVTGNTPEVRGTLVDSLLRASPGAAVLSVSVHATATGHPVVQRCPSGVVPRLRDIAAQGTTGDPVVILRQDLHALWRAADRPHVILVLPENLDLLPLLAELWRRRVGSGSMGDYYDPAPVVVGVDPASFTYDIACVHRAVRLWGDWDDGERVTRAEAAARQVEAADVLFVPAARDADGQVTGAAGLARHLNPRASLLTPADGDGLPPALVRVAPPGLWEERQAWLEPVTMPCLAHGPDGRVESVLWRARRPLHPERLSAALAEVARGVVRSRGHLWLPGRPDSIVTWRTAGAHLELREAGSWLGADSPDAWASVSPRRRTLASWFWHDYYGERRDEIVFTGVDIDGLRIRAALDEALLSDAELSLGRDGWRSLADPLIPGGGNP
ncbi:GTP-binding protein [Streptomyces sp. NPDC058459]|uniref:GTP-binding protein n=1 Tax=Streptomyces sp. NPDC058459 TaxID=3346508 RepID=UPI00365899A4